MPFRIINDDGLLVVDIVKLIDDGIGLVGNLFVELPPFFVILIDILTHLAGNRTIFSQQQLDGFFAFHHTPGGIDTRADFKYDVADRDFLPR